MNPISVSLFLLLPNDCRSPLFGMVVPPAKPVQTRWDSTALTLGASRSTLHIRVSPGLRFSVDGLPTGSADQAHSGCRKASEHGSTWSLGERIMRGVTTRQETRNCQKRLKGALIKGLNQESDLTIGYRGGNKKCTVNHNGTVWFYSEEQKGGFWNVFGLDPDESGQNDIVIEINPPLHGVDLQKGAGMFAFEQEDSLYLLHSGRIGGGRKGIGARAFRQWYLRYAPVRDVEISKGKREKGFLVGNISDEKSFLDDLEAFIKKVSSFKKLATNQPIDTKRDALLSDLQKTGRKTDLPERRTTTITTYERNQTVTELAKLMAKGKCRLCKKKGPFQDQVLNLPFLETHHVKWLSEGGRDSIDNIVALCPNCHRKMHHVADKGDVVALRKIAKEQQGASTNASLP